MVAVEFEARGLGRRLHRGEDRRLPRLQPVVLRAIGVGASGLARLDREPVVRAAGAVLVTGLAGGCAPQTAPGDLVVADAVGTVAGDRWRPTDPRLRVAAAGALGGLPAHVGRLLTVPRVMGTPEEKAGCWRAHRALAVEMETAHVLDWAAARGLPALAVRAVADGPADALSAALVGAMTPGGRARPAAVGGWLLEPGLAVDAWRLWRRSRLALDRLGRFLVALTARPVGP